MSKRTKLYAGSIPLNRVQLALLEIMSHEPPGTWFTARVLSLRIDFDLISPLPTNPDEEATDEAHHPSDWWEIGVRKLFAGNKVGMIMSYMKKQGLVISKPNPNPRKHARTLYALGPMADVLKEAGVID